MMPSEEGGAEITSDARNQQHNSIQNEWEIEVSMRLGICLLVIGSACMLPMQL